MGANQSVLGTGYFLALAKRSAARAQDAAARSFHRLQERAGRGKERRRLLEGKAAELHLARCLAEEGGGLRIRVNIVNPDAVLQGPRS